MKFMVHPHLWFVISYFISLSYVSWSDLKHIPCYQNELKLCFLKFSFPSSPIIYLYCCRHTTCPTICLFQITTCLLQILPFCNFFPLVLLDSMKSPTHFHSFFHQWIDQSFQWKMFHSIWNVLLAHLMG